MKVLAVTHGLRLGGAQLSTLEFLENLKYFVELRVLVCKDAKEEFVSHIRSLGVEVYRIPCQSVANYPYMHIEGARKLVERTDIVWIADESYLVASHIKKLRRVPIVAHLRSYALICPWWAALYGLRKACLERCSLWRITRCKQCINLELARIELLNSVKASIYWLLDFVKGPLDYFKWLKLLRGVIDSIDAFLPVSKALWEIYVSHIPELKDKPFKVIYNPVTEPLKYVRPNLSEPHDNYILYASSSNPVKGPHILLEAWSKISKEFKDLKLYMAGCKDTWVEKLAKKLDIKNVVFLKRLPPSKHYYFMMYMARAVVVPSLWPEPFGRIPIEANRLGVPAIVTNRGGLSEIIENGVTGVISNADSESLADAIVKSLSRKWDRSVIVKSTYERISPQVMIDELLKFFEDMLK